MKIHNAPVLGEFTVFINVRETEIGQRNISTQALTRLKNKSY
jgi:hypothetical protein